MPVSNEEVMESIKVETYERVKELQDTGGRPSREIYHELPWKKWEARNGDVCHYNEETGRICKQKPNEFDEHWISEHQKFGKELRRWQAFREAQTEAPPGSPLTYDHSDLEHRGLSRDVVDATIRLRDWRSFHFYHVGRINSLCLRQDGSRRAIQRIHDAKFPTGETRHDYELEQSFYRLMDWNSEIEEAVKALYFIEAELRRIIDNIVSSLSTPDLQCLMDQQIRDVAAHREKLETVTGVTDWSYHATNPLQEDTVSHLMDREIELSRFCNRLADYNRRRSQTEAQADLQLQLGIHFPHLPTTTLQQWAKWKLWVENAGSGIQRAGHLVECWGKFRDYWKYKMGPGSRSSFGDALKDHARLGSRCVQSAQTVISIKETYLHDIRRGLSLFEHNHKLSETPPIEIDDQTAEYLSRQWPQPETATYSRVIVEANDIEHVPMRIRAHILARQAAFDSRTTFKRKRDFEAVASLEQDIDNHRSAPKRVRFEDPQCMTSQPSASTSSQRSIANVKRRRQPLDHNLSSAQRELLLDGKQPASADYYHVADSSSESESFTAEPDLEVSTAWSAPRPSTPPIKSKPQEPKNEAWPGLLPDHEQPQSSHHHHAAASSSETGNDKLEAGSKVSTALAAPRSPRSPIGSNAQKPKNEARPANLPNEEQPHSSHDHHTPASSSGMMNAESEAALQVSAAKSIPRPPIPPTKNKSRKPKTKSRLAGPSAGLNPGHRVSKRSQPSSTPKKQRDFEVYKDSPPTDQSPSNNHSSESPLRRSTRRRTQTQRFTPY